MKCPYPRCFPPFRPFAPCPFSIMKHRPPPIRLSLCFSSIIPFGPVGASLSGDMNKRVLLAIDLDMPDSRAASYAVQLAARLKLSLVLMAVFPARGASPPGAATPLTPATFPWAAWRKSRACGWERSGSAASRKG